LLTEWPNDQFQNSTSIRRQQANQSKKKKKKKKNIKPKTREAWSWPMMLKFNKDHWPMMLKFNEDQR
jgi:hypothetical protein